MNAMPRTTESAAIHLRDHPDAETALRRLTGFVYSYLAVSVLTIVAIVLLRDHSGLVNPAVWIRASIVVASALVTTALAARTARGSRAAYRRLRIISSAMVLAITVIIAIPGSFPMWMKADQALCGLALIGVVVIINGPQLRGLFAQPAK